VGCPQHLQIVLPPIKIRSIDLVVYLSGPLFQCQGDAFPVLPATRTLALVKAGFGVLEWHSVVPQGGTPWSNTLRPWRAALRSFLLAIALFFAPLPLTSEEIKILNVSYDPTRELYAEINALFAERYKSRSGLDVSFEQSHGGSSKQARSVIDGLPADVVTLALAWDITAIERAGLIKPGWQQRLPYNSAPFTSTVAFLVRKGNPKNIKDWTDLTRPDVQVIVPNPKTSGGGRWAFLALWAAVAKAKTHDFSSPEGLKEGQAVRRTAKDFPAYKNDEARAVIEKFYNNNVPVLDTGARGSTVTFAQKQLGDVLLNWENELWLARDEFGKDNFEIVCPPRSILGEPPVAVVDGVVDKKGTRDVAEAYLKFLYTSEAQETAAQLHYRPRDISALQKHSAELPSIPLFTIDETFGGWPKAHEAFFAEGAFFDQIYRPANK
jgi:ABC-type sulfate transport system substrate-binding protein